MFRWHGTRPPDMVDVRLELNALALDGITWGNGEGDTYPAHAHPYPKTLLVLQGSIGFTFPEYQEDIVLQQGDRLELPAGILHSAVVGDPGVTCWEAHWAVGLVRGTD